MLSHEKRRSPDVTCYLLVPPVRAVPTQSIILCFLALNVTHGVFGQPCELHKIGCQGLRFDVAHLQLNPLFTNVFAVLLAVGGCSRLVVSSDGFVCVVGDAVQQRILTQNAHETVSTANTMVEEAERLAVRVPLNPERDLTEIHGKWVLVHAIDAATDRVAHGFTVGFGCGFGFACTQAGDFCRDASRRRKQKVS